MGFGGSCEDRLRSLCGDAGLNLDQLGLAVVERLRLLSERSETIDDCLRNARLAQDVFRYYEAYKPSAAFTPAEQRIVILGSLFSDIGKTGPANADLVQQQLIVDMFAVEGVRDDRQSVATFLRTYFPDDALERIASFEAMDLSAEMPMREFWNLHSSWTLDIAHKGGVPLEVIAAAATHHMLENINPSAIVNEDGRFSSDFGDNARFDRAEKLVILLDKYDAIRRRGRGTHEDAMQWLRQKLDKNPRFRDDDEFKVLLDDLEIVARGRKTSLRPPPPPTR